MRFPDLKLPGAQIIPTIISTVIVCTIAIVTSIVSSYSCFCIPISTSDSNEFWRDCFRGYPVRPCCPCANTIIEHRLAPIHRSFCSQFHSLNWDPSHSDAIVFREIPWTATAGLSLSERSKSASSIESS